jgi:nucleoid DNA-binding protein
MAFSKFVKNVSEVSGVPKSAVACVLRAVPIVIGNMLKEDDDITWPNFAVFSRRLWRNLGRYENVHDQYMIPTVRLSKTLRDAARTPLIEGETAVRVEDTMEDS